MANKVVIPITGNSEGFQSALLALAPMASKAMTGVGAALAVGGIALFKFGASTIRVGKEYEQSMANVAATMGITASSTVKDFEIMDNAAKLAGATTKYTASEAAEALNYLALAGYDAEKAAAALPPVLSLAAAGNIDLGKASDMVTDSMAALGLEMKDLESFTDKMAKTAQKSNTNVEQLGEGILTVGGTAKIMKGGVTELNTVLGLLADNGIKGAEGGTHLRNMLLSLASPTSAAKGIMKDFGLEVFDAQGNMRSMEEIVGDLNVAMADLTDEEKTKALAAMFNKRDLKAVNALLGTSSERWVQLGIDIENSGGAAEQMAETQLDTLEGRLKILKSIIESLQISFYEAFKPAVKKLIEGITAAIGWIYTHSDDIVTGLEAIAIALVTVGAVKGILAISGKFQALKASIALTQGAWKTYNQYQALGIVMSKTATAVTSVQGIVVGVLTKQLTLGAAASQLFGKALGVIKAHPLMFAAAAIAAISFAIIKLIKHKEDIQEFGEKLPEYFQIGIDKAVGVFNSFAALLPVIINEIIPKLITAIQGLFTSMVSVAENNAGTIADTLMSLGETILTTIVDLAPKVVNMAGVIFEKLLWALADGLPMMIQSGTDLLVSLIEGFTERLPAATEAMIAIIDALALAISENLPVIIEAGLNILLSIINTIIENLPLLIDMGVTLMNSLVNAIIENLPLILKAGVTIVLSLVEALIENIPKLIESGLTLITALADAIIANIEVIIMSAIQIILALAEGLIKSLPILIAAAPKIIWALVKAILGLIGAIIDVGISLIKALWEGIKSMTSWLWGKVTGFAKDLPGKIVEGLGNIGEIGMNLVIGLWNGIKDKGEWIKDKLFGFGEGVKNKLKSIFGVESPSKFTIWIGEMMTKGLGNGLDKYAKNAISSASNLAANIKTPFEDLNDMSSLFSNSKMSLDFIRDNMGLNINATRDNQMLDSQSQSAGSYNQVININREVDTPDKIARALRLEKKYGLIGG